MVVADHLPLDVSIFSVKHRIFEKPRGLISVDTEEQSQTENELLTDRRTHVCAVHFISAPPGGSRLAVQSSSRLLSRTGWQSLEQQVAAKVFSVTHGAVTSREQTPAKLGRRFREYSIERTRHLQCPADREPCWSDQAQASALWTRLRKDVLRSFQGAPRACWTEVQPDLENLKLCGEDLRGQLARCMVSRHQKRLQDWKQYMRKDWEDNYGRAVCRWIGNDQTTRFPFV